MNIEKENFQIEMRIKIKRKRLMASYGEFMKILLEISKAAPVKVIIIEE